MIWGINVVFLFCRGERGWGPVHIPNLALCWYHVIGSYSPELPPCQILPFINKSRDGGIADHRGLL